MADNVRVAQVGAAEKTLDDVDTIQDIIDNLDLDNPSIKVNGQTVDADHTLSDYEYVSFGAKVKGGC